MNVFLNVLVGIQMLSALAMIGLILVQHGKGADMGAAFGSGSAGSLFGASGSANFLSRSTAVLAAVFFACTLGLAYMSHGRTSGGGSLLERAASQPAAPARTDAAPAATPPAPASEIPSSDAAPATPASAPVAAPDAKPAAPASEIPSK